MGAWTLVIPRFEEEWGYNVLALSVLPPVTNTFCRTFLSNHALQPLETRYGASPRDPTCRLPNSGPPLIYFLFYDLVYFPTFLLVSNIFRRTFLSNHVSQGLQIWHGASARCPTRRLPNSGPPVIYFLF